MNTRAEHLTAAATHLREGEYYLAHFDSERASAYAAMAQARAAAAAATEPTDVTDLGNRLDAAQTELITLRRVVAQHIADGYASGNPAAAGLARSLATELDAAGVNVDRDVDRLRDEVRGVSS